MDTKLLPTSLLDGERALITGCAGTPEDIAQVAVAVLSERFGRYVVGTTVEVDGGPGLISWIPPKP
jgi:NAD(P)-dependent dehydrogenase (short-subunit alcohol dehydrogenase family)